MKTTFDNSGAARVQLSGTEYESLLAKAAALDVAVTGLRKLQELYDAGRRDCEDAADSNDFVVHDWTLYLRIVGDLSGLLNEIGGTR